jgi:hypothetical protein
VKRQASLPAGFGAPVAAIFFAARLPRCAALSNYGSTEALIVNMPAPAWTPESPDEWPVEGWTDPEGWQEAEAGK